MFNILFFNTKYIKIIKIPQEKSKKILDIEKKDWRKTFTNNIFYFRNN